jgi:hypothetical protein
MRLQLLEGRVHSLILLVLQSEPDLWLRSVVAVSLSQISLSLVGNGNRARKRSDHVEPHERSDCRPDGFCAGDVILYG